MDLLKILDDVLEQISNTKGVHTLLSVQVIVTNDEVNMETVENCIDKLIEDGYVFEDTYTDYMSEAKPKTFPVFKVSFSGQFFLSRGGYQSEFLRENSERIRMFAIETQQMENNQQIVLLTKWIAGGTIMAAIYYLIEILKWVFIPNNP